MGAFAPDSSHERGCMGPNRYVLLPSAYYLPVLLSYRVFGFALGVILSYKPQHLHRMHCIFAE